MLTLFLVALVLGLSGYVMWLLWANHSLKLVRENLAMLVDAHLERINTLENEVFHLEDELHDKRLRLEATVRDWKELQEQYENLEQEYSDLSNDYDELEYQKGNLEDECLYLEEQVDDLRWDLDDLQDEIDKLESELSEVKYSNNEEW